MEAFLHDLSWVPPLRNEMLTQVFNAFTFLGYTPFFLAFLPIGYWLWDKPVFTRLAILVGIVGLSNAFLKDLFQDPRPPIEFALDPRVSDSFGLPSGHAQIAAAMWLWLALEIDRAWAWLLAILITIGVAASRVYLGVHDIEDVVAGTLLGIATVIIYRGFIFGEFPFLQRLHPVVYLLAILSLGPILFELWPRQPVPLTIIASLVTFMAAWLLGHIIHQSGVQHHRHPNWFVAGLSSIAAIVILFAIFFVSGQKLTAAGIPPATVLAIQSGFMSIFATLIAPALFRLLGLSRPTS